MKKEVLAWLLAAAFVLPVASSTSTFSLEKDRYDESFYEKTRLIMTKAEIKIYKFLKEPQEKEEFIQEFWKIRDPDPSTEENEAKVAFDERVRYACRWFSAQPTRAWREDYEPQKKDRGWETDMGKIYILLGPPDTVLLGEQGLEMRGDFDRRSVVSTQESWFYNKWNLWLAFEGKELNFQQAASPLLFEAMESAKMDLINSESKGDLGKCLKFEAAYRNGSLVILVPTTRVIFKDEEQKLQANFRVRVHIYQDHKKIDSLETEKSLVDTEDSLLEKKHLRLDIPYNLPPGKNFVFDILMQDLNSNVYSRYRDLIKTRS